MELLQGNICKMKYKIVACIPTKNEEWIIEKTLSSLSNFCHKIIVVDDQSDDKTCSICEKFEKVELYHRHKHDWKERAWGEHRQEILDYAIKHDPDYLLFLDADEIPSPDIVDFFDDVDESVNLWYLPWYHLWTDENHYRVDNFYLDNGQYITFDPENGAQKKGFIMKYDKNHKYNYDINRFKGWGGPMEPQNVPLPHSKTTKTRVIHYGRISPRFKSGEKHVYVSTINNHVDGMDYNERLKTHKNASQEDTLILKKIKDEWKWTETI